LAKTVDKSVKTVDNPAILGKTRSFVRSIEFSRCPYIGVGKSLPLYEVFIRWDKKMPSKGCYFPLNLCGKNQQGKPLYVVLPIDITPTTREVLIQAGSYQHIPSIYYDYD
jgi:hypothetical protein